MKAWQSKKVPEKKIYGTSPEAEALVCECEHSLSEHRDGKIVGLGITCWFAVPSEPDENGTRWVDICKCEDFTLKTTE